MSWAAVLLLLGIGILFYQGWIIFAILIFFLGIRHPPPLNDLTALDAKRWAVGGLAAAVLVSGFVLVPIAQPTGTFAASSGGVASSSPPSTGVSYNLSLVIDNRDFVAHGFLLSGQLTRVVVSSGGIPRNLTGPEFANYSANSSWSVTLPNGTVLRFPMGGNFSLSSSEYSPIDSGKSARFSLLFSNPQPAALSWSVTVSELCNSGGAPPQTVGYQFP